MRLEFYFVLSSVTCKYRLNNDGWNVRFGSKADICAAQRHVRFAPNSDRESRHPQTVMSALPSKADMCGAMIDVCYGPKADMGSLDHLVSNLLDMGGHLKSERFGGLEINQ